MSTPLIPETERGDRIEDEPKKQSRRKRRDQLLDVANRRRSSLGLLKDRINSEVLLRKSSIKEALPKTYYGWIALISSLILALIRYELGLQKSLTRPPIVWGQVTSNKRLKKIYAILTASPSAILRRNIRPSMFVGTRATITSTAAYLLRGPSLVDRLQFEETLILPADGAKLSLQWEFPAQYDSGPAKATNQESYRFAPDSVDLPVVLILHGINNHAKFGYVRSLMRSCTDKGWIAVGMNFRGCGGVSLRTPRSYNGAYTGDLRAVVQVMQGRLAANVPILLVGNSLGANLVAKYLGEEGLSNTLPSCVAGGVTLGNPMLLRSGNISPPVSAVLALGAKLNILQQWRSLKNMAKSTTFRQAITGALTGVSIANFDTCLAPTYVRNNLVYPHQVLFGYKDGPAYWKDASSYRVLPHVSVPLLQVVAGDDFIVYKPFNDKLSFSVSNPNVMVVETKTGGHLGWHEAPPDEGMCGVGTSWADVVTVDFINAVLQTQDMDDHGAHNDANALFLRREVEGLGLRSKL